MIVFFYKSICKVISVISSLINKKLSTFIFIGNNVHYANYKTIGIPYIVVAKGGKCTIGENFSMNNGVKGNPIGCYKRCTIFVDRGAELVIGHHVGISQTALICHKSIKIGNYVKIGGGVCIYDTDFHSLDPNIRKSKDDLKSRIDKPVIIHDNVFIGAYSIILKGVIVGENSIIGAGSVVTKSVPENQIWAGNPARYIRDIRVSY